MLNPLILNYKTLVSQDIWYFAWSIQEHSLSIISLPLLSWSLHSFYLYNRWASLVSQLVKNLPAMQETPVWVLGWDVPLETEYSWASQVLQAVKNLPTRQETWVPSLGWEDLLKEGMATHSSILAWRIPMDRGAWEAKIIHGVTKSWTRLSD